MNRLEEIRTLIDNIIYNISDDEERRCAYIHLYGVSKLSSMIAMKRGLNSEIACVAGMLHDLFAYRTGIHEEHDKKGSKEARKLLDNTKLYDEDEIKIIVSAIYHHSDKDNVHGEYDELLKDAEVLQHYLYNVTMPIEDKEKKRLIAILNEFGLEIE